MSWKCNNCETLNPDSQIKCEVCGGIPPLFVDFSCSCHDINKSSVCKCHVDKADTKFLQIDDDEPFEIFKNEIALDIKKSTKLTLIASNKYAERRKSIKVEIEKPSVQYFEVSEKSVLEGENVSVKWMVLNAERCAINGEKKDCEGEENITASKELTIKASNSVGEESQSLHLTIFPRPTISFKASKQKLHAGKGEKVTLTWDVKNAENCCLIYPDGTNHSHKNKDSVVITPNETSKYVLRTTALDKKTVIDTPVIIEVCQDAEVQFSSDKEYVFPSIPFIISWQIKNAKRVALNGKIVRAADSITFTDGIEKNTTYTLSVTDEFGKKDYPLTIKMLPLPQVKSLLIPTPKLENSLSITVQQPRINAEVKFPKISMSFANMKIPYVPSLSDLGLDVKLSLPRRDFSIKSSIKRLFNHIIKK